MENIKNTSVIEFATSDLESMNCSQLSDYVVQKHHQYAIKAIAQIKPLIEKVVAMNATDHPQMKSIKDYFRLISNELQLHMQKEELVLFPYIHKLVLADKDGTQLTTPGFGSIKSPVSVMLTEHETIGIMAQKVVRLSSGFKAPADVNDTVLELYARLKEFDEDLQEHVRLENDILFPKAIELEQKLLFASE
jgi:regulator of cell morphogenesis and NO signaling